MTFPWLKGHGTENDFVLLPDHDGTLHGDLESTFVADLCDRRRGLGADGVLRVIRSSALGVDTDAEWFMDYRNADGSISEMCGNGIRVFARHLVDAGLVDGDHVVPIGTRDGVKDVTIEGPFVSVDMGVPQLRGTSKVRVADRLWEAQDVRTGNPHAVVHVDVLTDAGSLLDEPDFDPLTYPDGVNVEFVVRRDERHIAMRVHERGSGETRSCGTGACAAAVATMVLDGAARPATYCVDVPGGRLTVTWTPDGHMILAGPAEIVASGEMTWFGQQEVHA